MSYALFIVQHRWLENSQVAAAMSENPNTAFPKQGLWCQLLFSHIHIHMATEIQDFASHLWLGSSHFATCSRTGKAPEEPDRSPQALQLPPPSSLCCAPLPSHAGTPQSKGGGARAQNRGTGMAPRLLQSILFAACLRLNLYLEAKLLP